jgi:outer membrane protein, heavy metal efflux system
MNALRLLFALIILTLCSSRLMAQSNEFFQMVERAAKDAPAVQSAKIDIERAQETSKKMQAGPYEFEVFMSRGRREINDAMVTANEFTEWEAGVSRKIRLPGKRSIDQELAELEVEFAQIKYEKALNDELLAFIARWNAWSRLAMLSDVMDEQLADARKLAEMEQQKVDNGAGRQVHADQLMLDAELVYLEAEQNRLATINARSNLESAYPNVVFPLEPMSFDFASLGELISEEQVLQPEQRLAEIASKQAMYTSKRARQNRIPDPTLQLSYLEELDGLENSVVASISIPIGGAARSSAYREADAYSRMRVLDLERAQREVNQNYKSSRQGYLFAIENMDRAKDSLEMSREVLSRISQGYDTGSLTLTELIAARRSQRQTERYIIEQTSKAELAAMKFWILATDLRIAE